MPAVTNLCLLGGIWPRQLSVEAGTNVDRVEFRLDNTLLGIAYGPPFDFYLSPSALGLSPSGLAGDHRIMATAMDRFNQVAGITDIRGDGAAARYEHLSRNRAALAQSPRFHHQHRVHRDGHGDGGLGLSIRGRIRAATARGATRGVGPVRAPPGAGEPRAVLPRWPLDPHLDRRGSRRPDDPRVALHHDQSGRGPTPIHGLCGRAARHLGGGGHPRFRSGILEAGRSHGPRRNGVFQPVPGHAYGDQYR